ncbi:hypothetical protein BLA24064_02809 [Burkholderia latens]|uniref:Uncharacterized protein n=1 Tax=Burkholderia latens TaxID=488446 RepID=A0A6P2L183_9BURK|nr:hypothetical protein BLA24064_02809 [Burkholderia latens]
MTRPGNGCRRGLRRRHHDETRFRTEDRRRGGVIAAVRAAVGTNVIASPPDAYLA